MNQLPEYSRRRFLALSGAAGVSALIAACGGKSAGISGLNGDLQVVKRFPDNGLVPGTVRLPISLADKSGIFGTGGKVKLPQTLTGKVIDSATGEVLVQSITAQQHSKEMSTPYWPFIFDIEKTGVMTLMLDIAPNTEVSFLIEERKDVFMPLVGDALPPFNTPTIDNARGVNPICTRPEGTCPFHSVTLTEALQSGKPVVYFIGTPAFCKTGTCAPGLTALIDIAKSVGDTAVFVHADVYKDKTATEAAPAVQAYKLTYEPILYITDAKGKLINRLDAVFDVDEMRSALAAAGIS
ncbi:unannotated protein [freshwater metagenome]|uniref:Unannotated protein n=1 Tax=freshwater metagenome TaxID=449393 RepID=A0A6J6HZN6_9ZZZZ|nr:hypothetical protein [Actinomycetota bacterium]